MNTNLELLKRSAYLLAEIVEHNEPRLIALRRSIVEAIKNQDPAYYGVQTKSNERFT